MQLQPPRERKRDRQRERKRESEIAGGVEKVSDRRGREEKEEREA